MLAIKRLRSCTAFFVVGVLVLVGCVAPWFFGAWEMWWFWPFVAVLSLGTFVAGIGVVLGEGVFTRPVVTILLLCVPFLVYVALRWWWADVVFLDAERTWYLHLTGICVAMLTVCVLREKHAVPLFWALYLSLLAMSVYGILNHIFAESRHVLWAPRYEQYAGRATGPYFCPDHFAGAMEILLCMGLGLLLDRASRAGRRILGFLACGLGIAGALMSLSRGSGMTLIVIMVLVGIWGFHQWPLPVRNAWRLTFGALGLLIFVSVFAVAVSYRDRFISYGGLNHVSVEHDVSLGEQVVDRLLRTSRGRMFAGAWRAWQPVPWLGIGPGMHQHYWPAVAASGDGDRDAGIWPTLINDDFHSYEVHNDWLQLFQEHGIVGGGLFLVGFFCVIGVFLFSFKRVSIAWALHEMAYVDTPPVGYGVQLAALLALGAMAFHSLGDFNLQMPGTVWILGVLVGLGLRQAGVSRYS